MVSINLFLTGSTTESQFVMPDDTADIRTEHLLIIMEIGNKRAGVTVMAAIWKTELSFCDAVFLCL